jgi:tyrosyl-tRNA synthetase
MAELQPGIGLPALFVRAGLASSNSEVRRAVANNAVRVNDVQIADAQRTVGPGDINAEGVIKLSLGRKKHALVVPG